MSKEPRERISLDLSSRVWLTIIRACMFLMKESLTRNDRTRRLIT